MKKHLQNNFASATREKEVTTRARYQKDRRDICGFADWAVPLVGPPTARRIESSKSSRLCESSFPAASLNADDDVVAKDSS